MKKIALSVIIVLSLGGLLGGILGLFVINGLLGLHLSSFFSALLSSPSRLFNSVIFVMAFIFLGFAIPYFLILRKNIRGITYGLDSSLDANKAKDEFISMLLHFIRTPLSGIRWSLNEMIKETTAKEKESLTRLYTENTRALNAVEHLLDVSRASMDKIVFSFEVLPIKDIVEFIKIATDTLSLQAKEKNISVDVRLSIPSKNSIKIDKTKILLIIETLFENTLLYTPDRGSIKVITEEKQSDFLFSISDTGIGISDKDKPKIFLQFFRGGNARHKFPDGFGVGLYIVKTFVEKHNGKVWFTSKEGVGTTFTFKLPMITNPTESFFEKI